MIEQEKYFYVVSFTARSQAGVAIIIATSEAVAFSILKQSGVYNATPDDYGILKTRNVGKYCGIAYGLMIESYTNALVAYDALMSVADKIIGPQGPQGPKGDKGDEHVLLSDVEYAELEREGKVDPTLIYFIYETEE